MSWMGRNTGTRHPQLHCQTAHSLMCQPKTQFESAWKWKELSKQLKFRPELRQYLLALCQHKCAVQKLPLIHGNGSAWNARAHTVAADRPARPAAYHKLRSMLRNRKLHGNPVGSTPHAGFERVPRG